MKIGNEIRTAKVSVFNEGQGGRGLAKDSETNEEIYFEMSHCRMVFARDNKPVIGDRSYNGTVPRPGNEILYVPNNRKLTPGEKKSAFVWGFRYFYEKTLKQQHPLWDLENAFCGRVTIDAPSTTPPTFVTVSRSETKVNGAKTPTPQTDWSPGRRNEAPVVTAPPPNGNGDADAGDGELSLEELAIMAGGRNGGNKTKPGQPGYIYSGGNHRPRHHHHHRR